MARRRRKFKISGDEYTFGGGASSESVSVGTLKIARGNLNTANANHIGFVENGASWEIKLDAGTAIESKDQYVYFDNAFETNLKLLLRSRVTQRVQRLFGQSLAFPHKSLETLLTIKS